MKPPETVQFRQMFAWFFVLLSLNPYLYPPGDELVIQRDDAELVAENFTSATFNLDASEKAWCGGINGGELIEIKPAPTVKSNASTAVLRRGACERPPWNSVIHTHPMLGASTLSNQDLKTMRKKTGADVVCAQTGSRVGMLTCERVTANGSEHLTVKIVEGDA